MSPSSPLSLYTFHFYEVNPHKKNMEKPQIAFLLSDYISYKRIVLSFQPT